jgi:hypothetical protein
MSLFRAREKISFLPNNAMNPALEPTDKRVSFPRGWNVKLNQIIFQHPVALVNDLICRDSF